MPLRVRDAEAVRGGLNRKKEDRQQPDKRPNERPIPSPQLAATATDWTCPEDKG